ncbi:interleukin-10 isoform X1 [Macaca thibetana thibetana]|uniref:interleukin-10 isoform X1 n=1 Tax=Macaca thibetana thibetana TaxID=257877 RepID=UPI0021BCE38F|nr:interleukin-10 isoform X1 [Macaca thibetana thibetana]
MHSSALLCCLVLLTGVRASPGQGTQSENSCTRFPGNLPHMLRDLRDAFSRVKTFFQMKDQLDNILLKESLLEDFKGYLGCQALSEMIQFYLEEVMPQAENHDPDIKEHVNSLGENLKTLRLRLRRCVSRRTVLSLAAAPKIPSPTDQHPETLTSRDTAKTQTGRASCKCGKTLGVRSLAHFSLSRRGGWLLGIYM